MLVDPLRATDQVKRHRYDICDKHDQFGNSRSNRNRERNSIASCNPWGSDFCPSESTPSRRAVPSTHEAKLRESVPVLEAAKSAFPQFVEKTGTEKENCRFEGAFTPMYVAIHALPRMISFG